MTLLSEHADGRDARPGDGSADLPDRSAPTDVSITALLRDRFSPRAFDPDRPVSGADLRGVLEAARWSPSAANEQPWLFVVADRQRDPQAHQAVLDALMPGNQRWASTAPVLVVAAALTTRPDGTPRSHAAYDTGQAMAHLSVEAVARGLAVHQMGGFHADQVAAATGLPDTAQPLVVAALGYRAHHGTLDADLAEREVAARTRKPFDEVVAGGRAGTALDVDSGPSGVAAA